MLDDRDYMRQPEYHDSGWVPRFRFRWSWTFGLIALYVLVFLAGLVADKFFPNNHFFHGHLVPGAKGPELYPGYLPLSAEGLAHGFVWQLVTYQFMHASLLHILGNSWVIYMFGRELEDLLGVRKYLALIFSTGIVGGVCQVLVAQVWPQYFGTHMAGAQFFSGETVGASACAFGLVAAFAMLFPERELTMLILFVIPIHMRAKMLLIGEAVLALAGFSFPDIIMPGVAHAAHLGGMVMGWFFVRKILQGDWSRLSGGWSPAESRKPALRRPVLVPLEEKAPADFVASEVDPILDKISAHGIQSLTAREREVLESARKHIKR